MNLLNFVTILSILVTIAPIDAYPRPISGGFRSHFARRVSRAIHGLYSDKDDVEILTTEKFKKEVYNSKSGWFVEFYASWCGYCQRLAPIWKEFATNSSSWADLVKVSVVDCSEPTNTPLCRKYKVVTYPTLRYFHEDFQDTKDDLGVKVEKNEESVQAMKNLLIEQIREDQRRDKGKIYPELLPIEDKTLDYAFEEAKKLQHKYGFIIFENVTGPYYGAEAALDFHLNSNFKILPVSFNNSDIIKSLNLNYTTPSLYVMEIDSKKIEPLLEDVKSELQIHDSIKSYLNSKNIEPQIYIKPKKNITDDEDDRKFNSDKEALRAFIKKMGDVVFQADLESALRHSFKYEVAVTGTISGEKLEALRNFVKVLVKYFPFGEHGKEFLKDLCKFLGAKDEIPGNAVSDLVMKAESSGKVFSTAHQWLACDGSSERYRRYPCGLWKLFHYLTVNMDQDNFDNEVLKSMHGYIKNFFGCVGCSKHFQEMAARRNLTSVWSRDNGILWLWSAHNEVNERLSGDTTEDPEYRKIQFPSAEQCTTCYDFENERFVRQEVLNYLKRVYGRHHVRYLGANTKILFKGLEDDSKKA